MGLNVAGNNHSVERVGVCLPVNDNEIHTIKEVQNIGRGIANLNIGLLEDLHHLRRCGAQLDAVNLLQLDNLNERNRRHRIFSVAAFDITSNGLRQPSVVGEIPNQGFGVEQILHYLPVLKGSATKYSHLGRYCTFLRFWDFLFFFKIASIVSIICKRKSTNFFYFGKIFFLFVFLSLHFTNIYNLY